jgi:hypothetical protein
VKAWALPMMTGMAFDGTVPSTQKQIVRVFFKEMWDKQDKSLISSIRAEFG